MNRLTDKRMVNDFYAPKTRAERHEIMTNVPDIKAIYNRLAAYEDTGLEPHEVAELKKKAVPIRPEYEADGYDDKGELDYDTAYCPVCRRMYEVGYEDGCKYCDNCGQALDWSDTNE